MCRKPPAEVEVGDAKTVAFALELDLGVDDVATLLEQSELRRRRAVRSVLHLVWHDTADGRHAAKGESVVERRQDDVCVWRLERMVPTATSVEPCGGLAGLIVEGTAPPVSAASLLPVAAFEGRLSTWLSAGEAGDGSVSVLQGELRAVAATRKICRVFLTGANAKDLAVAWSGRMRLQVPAHSLAAEAFALARRPAAGRPLGVPDLSDAETVCDGFALIVAHLAGVIWRYSAAARTGGEIGSAIEPVHQMRVALRRLRSATLLFRRAVGCPELDDATERLKRLGRVLGPPRDWDVFTAGAGREIGAVFADDASVTSLLAAAQRRRRQVYAELVATLDGPEWRQLGIRLAHLAMARPWRDFTPDDPERAVLQHDLQRAGIAHFAERALTRRLDRVLEPGADLDGLSVEALHELRLHCKRMRYAAEFFAPLFPGHGVRRFLRRLSALQEQLGHLNDTSVAALLMAELPSRGPAQRQAIGIVRGFVAANAAGSRARIDRHWRRFRKCEPFWG